MITKHINNSMTCPHYWISTKLDNFVQCMYCEMKKEVEDVEEVLTPEEEYRESL